MYQGSGFYHFSCFEVYIPFKGHRLYFKQLLVSARVAQCLISPQQTKTFQFDNDSLLLTYVANIIKSCQPVLN